MYVRNVFQFILENYNVSEQEAIEVWKKSHWYSLFHPLTMMVLVSGFLLKFVVFSTMADVFLYGFISAQDLCIAVVVLLYIFLWNFFRIRFIKNHLSDKKIG